MPTLPTPVTPADKLTALGQSIIGKKINGHVIVNATVVTDGNGNPVLSVTDDVNGVFKLFEDGTYSYAGKIDPATHTIDPGPDGGIITLPGLPKWFDLFTPGAANLDTTVEAASIAAGHDILGQFQQKVTDAVTGLPAAIANAIANALKGLVSLPFMIRAGEALLGVLILVIALKIFFEGQKS